MKPQEVTEALKLNQLRDKIWFVVPSCATTGEGLLEGLVHYFSDPSFYVAYHANFNPGMALKQCQIPAYRRKEIDKQSSFVHHLFYTQSALTLTQKPRLASSKKQKTISTCTFSTLQRRARGLGLLTCIHSGAQ
jgi:hypothetical protein